MNADKTQTFGISGIAVDIPPYRVRLEDWCQWTGADWDKIRKVVGHSFRIPGPQQSVYTMAANSVMRLIENYDIDPDRVRFLALGTESSTDNSAGAVIIKGMVDAALKLSDKPPLARNCEVPEFKHACLGGIYALKNALRYLSVDGPEAQAIVVSTDVALYERGTSGEPTQGAGAVAMLVESEPQLGSIDLRMAGTASDYRGVDFRKPIQYRERNGRVYGCRDLPVFNGRYSASCYVDEMLRALEHMYERRGIKPGRYVNEVEAVFMHRPFRRMPETGWGIAYLAALAVGDDAQRGALHQYCREAGVDPDALRDELGGRPDVGAFGMRERISDDVFPLCAAVMRRFRQTEGCRRHVLTRLALGADPMMQLGNLYTAALPAWIAAGFEEALDRGVDLDDKEMLLIGYGSGDAAEALPMIVTPGWQDAAGRIGLELALAEETIDLDFDQYIALREGGGDGIPGYTPANEFIIDRVGADNEQGYRDVGIEYYRYVPSASPSVATSRPAAPSVSAGTRKPAA